MPILLSTSKVQCEANYAKVMETGVVDSIDEIIAEIEENKQIDPLTVVPEVMKPSQHKKKYDKDNRLSGYIKKF